MKNFILCAGVIAVAVAAYSGARSQSPSAQINRFIEGIDADEQPMSKDEADAQLKDPWGVVLRERARNAEKFPANLKEVLAAVPLPNQSSFFVSETGQIPVDASAEGLQREFRVVVSRTQPG